MAISFFLIMYKIKGHAKCQLASLCVKGSTLRY